MPVLTLATALLTPCTSCTGPSRFMEEDAYALKTFVHRESFFELPA